MTIWVTVATWQSGTKSAWTSPKRADAEGFAESLELAHGDAVTVRILESAGESRAEILRATAIKRRTRIDQGGSP